MGMGKGPAKGSKGDDPTPAQDTPFSLLHRKQVRTLPPKGERKARTKARTKVRTKVAIKARAKAKVRTTKVD